MSREHVSISEDNVRKDKVQQRKRGNKTIGSNSEKKEQTFMMNINKKCS